MKQLFVILMLSLFALPVVAAAEHGVTDKPNSNSVVNNTESSAGTTGENTTENEAGVDAASEKTANSDSTTTSSNYNSSCKFNFLFYFIYKVKYDEEGNVAHEGLELEF